MAVNWSLPIPPSPVYVAQTTGASQARNASGSKEVFSLGEMEEAPDSQERFETATREFGEALQVLPPQHKAEIRVIHKAVATWVDQERAAGRKADKLATFVGRVMEYSNQSLGSIEDTDPDLVRRRDEYDKLDGAFRNGAALIDAYHAYVKDKSIP